MVKNAFFFSLDVLLLAEVHDSFRHLVKQEYGLSSDWFITLPSLAYDCLLYMIQESGDKVELVSDEAQYRFIQRSKRVINLSTSKFRCFDRKSHRVACVKF